ncbi:hypothetical protein FRC11_013776 [Ceratobasidium sp. 423]|nr:hypothetical protein FRC11_013776 [Ceratobasidium sp. 423]
MFKIDGTNYAINGLLELYVHNETGWQREITHESPELAFGALLQLGSGEPELDQAPSTDCSRELACRGVVEPVNGEGALPHFSSRPTREEIDDWVNAYKLTRKSRSTRGRNGSSRQSITCPLWGCKAVLARPSALKVRE